MINRSPITFVIGGCLLFGASMGIRMNFGILLNAYADYAGLPYGGISLVVAIGELTYGLVQPLFGVVAIRRSNAFVLKLGLCLLAAGLSFSAFARSLPLLVVTLGICLSAGTGAVCFGIVMGAISPFITPAKAAVVSGTVNASSGIGISVMSPLMSGLLASLGITKAMLALGPSMLALLPVAWRIGAANHDRDRTGDGTGPHDNAPMSGRRPPLPTVAAAIRCRTYRYLMVGFTTCGFHMSLIQNHLFSWMMSYGIDRRTAAFAYTMFGIGTMAGAFLCGLVCLRMTLKNVLGSLYLARTVIVVVFLILLPKNMITATVFAIVLGLTGDATVTPTSEIISRRFGTANMALLFGLTFLCHQICAFLGTWLTGVLLDATGSYLLMWMVDMALAILASMVSYRIDVDDLR